MCWPNEPNPLQNKVFIDFLLVTMTMVIDQKIICKLGRYDFSKTNTNRKMNQGVWSNWKSTLPYKKCNMLYPILKIVGKL